MTDLVEYVCTLDQFSCDQFSSHSQMLDRHVRHVGLHSPVVVTLGRRRERVACVCGGRKSLTSLKKALSFPQGGDLADFPSPVSQFLVCSQYLGPAPTNKLFSCQRIRSNRIQNQASVVMHTVSLSLCLTSTGATIGPLTARGIRVNKVL